MSENSFGWRLLVRRAVSGWAYLVAAVLVSLAAYLSGAEPAFSAILLGLSIVAILLRHGADEPADRSEIAPAPAPVEKVDGSGPVISAVLGALELPVFVLGRDAVLREQNRAAEKAFGALEPGLHISARFRSPSVLDMVRETIATDEPNQIEHSERLPSERVYIVRIAPLHIDGAREDLFLLSFKDISELRRIDRMRSDFVANASHELRTPLASLRGFIETLQGPAKNDAKAHERFLGIMHEQATRMSRLVDDLLSLSRLELRSNLTLDQTVDLVPLLGHVRDSLQPLASDLGVEVALDLPKHPVTVPGDRDELVEVFENLIENACKYGQEGKRVDVVLSGGGDVPVEFSVTDYGPGIPPEHVPRITERFYRVNVEASRSKKGTGLGLAIVKHILSRHRARLVVKSEVGKGTVFTVKF